MSVVSTLARESLPRGKVKRLRVLVFAIAAGISLPSPALPPLSACEGAHQHLISASGRTDKSNPDFALDRRQKYFDAHPIRPTEEAILQRMGIALFPSKEGFEKERAGEALDEWLNRVETFLAEHGEAPDVQNLVKEYLVDFGNHPGTQGFLPGDSPWDTPRAFATWKDFYDAPREHDLNGNVLRIKGYADSSLPANISGKDFDAGAKMYIQVKRNLSAHLGFSDIVRENKMSVEKALPQIAYIRREALQLNLIKFGEKMWKAQRSPHKQK